MDTDHKIHSVFKRDPDNDYKTFTNEFSDDVFAYLADNDWLGTEKIDGTNIRISVDEIGGRTDNAQIPTFLLPRLTEVQATLQDSNLPDDTILYGEGYGAKIQKGGGNYIPDGQDFILFDVLISGNWQEYENVVGISDHLGVAVVPQLASPRPLLEWVDAISRGHYEDSVAHPGAPNEGVVLRPTVELRTRGGSRIITKLKFKDFPE